MSTPTPEQAQQLTQQLIARCWTDAEFKARLWADPVATLTAEGIPVPEGHQIQVVESNANQSYFVIPPQPSDLSDEALDQMAGGVYYYSIVFCGCF